VRPAGRRTRSVGVDGGASRFARGLFPVLGTAERAARFLKAELKRADATYEELAKRLKEHGLKATRDSVAAKLKRGTFAATFFLACIAALELGSVALEDL